MWPCSYGDTETRKIDGNWSPIMFSIVHVTLKTIEKEILVLLYSTPCTCTVKVLHVIEAVGVLKCNFQYLCKSSKSLCANYIRAVCRHVDFPTIGTSYQLIIMTILVKH